MDNPEKLATLGTQDEDNKTKTHHNVELGCVNLQQYPDNCLQSQQCENRSVYESIRTFVLKTKLMLTLLFIGYTRRRQQNQNTSQYVLDTTQLTQHNVNKT
jgi:hypothetical protein